MRFTSNLDKDQYGYFLNGNYYFYVSNLRVTNSYSIVTGYLFTGTYRRNFILRHDKANPIGIE